MKKQRKKPQQSRKKTPSNAKQEPTRRDFMGLARTGLMLAPVVAAVGYFSVTSVQSSLAEADLTRVDAGLPTIVQIHDPQCSMCQTLQKQTRRALRQLPDDSYTYLVANIKTDAGLAFATRFGVSHVTLLLFDAEGEMTQIVRGPLASAQLKGILEQHMAMHGA